LVSPGKSGFYFTKEEQGMCYGLHWSQFPNDIEDVFSGIKSHRTEFIYTTSDYKKDGFLTLIVGLRNDNPDRAKKYYNMYLPGGIHKVRERFFSFFLA